jgi:putative SOS response-associated peptidase YedK
LWRIGLADEIAIDRGVPVILAALAYDRWLDADEPVSDLQALLRPYPADKMAAYPISTYVNNPRNQGPKCIEPQ